MDLATLGIFSTRHKFYSVKLRDLSRFVKASIKGFNYMTGQFKVLIYNSTLKHCNSLPEKTQIHS